MLLVQSASNNKFPKYHSASVTFEDILTIARKMRAKSRAVLFEGTVMEVLGTALNMGLLVDGRSPKEVQNDISNGTLGVPCE